MISLGFSFQNSVSCDFVLESECSGTAFFAVTSSPLFNDSNGNVLSANTAISTSSNYNKVLCCNSPYGDFSARFINAEDSCGDDVDLFYFTDLNNSRIAFPDERSDIATYNLRSDDIDFNLSFYKKKLCVGIPSGFGSFDIIVSDKSNYNKIGYDCMFRVSSVANGVVSSCDSEFNSGDSYTYSVWGRMFESLESLECNSDCTSKLDGRVYFGCSQKVKSCSSLRSLGTACDGALLGSWVDYGDDIHEIQCSAPWNTLREKIFTEEKVNVKVSDSLLNTSGCNNLISKKFPVYLNNEQVLMSIYMCED